MEEGMSDKRLKNTIKKIVNGYIPNADNDLLVNEIIHAFNVFLKDTCDNDDIKNIVKIYHETLPELPKVIKITDTRRKKVNKLLNSDIPTLEAWVEYFKIVGESDFLMGKTTPWKADFEWLINSTNALKVAEGRYSVKKENSNEYDWMDDL